MAAEKFCSVDNYSVLIPYKDLEKLVNLAQTNEEILRQVEAANERCAAMQMMYGELLEKVAEIKRML